MLKNRFILVIGVLSLLLVAMAVSLPRFNAVIIPVRGAQEARPYIMDSGTHSYIAWGEALEAAGKLGGSGTCLNMTRENIFARIPNDLDSATRSYMAWGLALQAKDDIQVVCR